MALQAGSGVSTSQVLVLVGAGLTSSIILRNGRLSELLTQLQELCKGVNEVEILPEKYNSSILRAQIQKLSEEIRELTLSGPVTIYNGNSDSGSYASYLIPAAALGAMGYCYMKWKGWSFSDVMYVTRHNMVNAVATVSKQLETVHETLASGIANRAVGETQMNISSSRSHCIYLFTVQQELKKDNKLKTGKLILVGLAGSEKAEKTRAEGKALEEAKTINKSLSALGNVINALTCGSSGKAYHIPYCDSKLTRLLQDALGGNSRTALLCYYSSSPSNSFKSGVQPIVSISFGCWFR